ncbi:MAG: hypothetical protein A6D91_06260 [Bacillaceae bacterium G1]|nr:ZIP family metal transporter [Bacillota bacterium]OJF16344.1 MAG: hypothetical protein A6D91_06260 [Bacillaceae bacterium G1]
MTSVLVFFSALANVLGGLLVVARTHWSERAISVLLGFSAGFLLSIALLDLIPASIAVHEANALFVLLGLLSVYFLGLVSSGHNHGEMTLHHAHGTTRRAAVGLWLGMLIHTFFDGASIVAAFDVGHQIGVLVFLAVILHKIPDGLTIATLVIANTKNRSKAVWSSISLGLSTLLGAMVMAGLLSVDVHWHPEELAAIALAFSAGAFLFVAIGDVLPEIHHQHKTFSTWAVLLGIAAYLLTAELLSLTGVVHHH